ILVNGSQLLGVLLPCGEHGLITAQVGSDGVFRQRDVVAVQQFAVDLGYGPVSREATVSHPTEDIPADKPPGQCQGEFSSGAQSAGTGRASGVGAMGQPAAQFQGALQGEEAMEAVVADVQFMAALQAALLLDIKNQAAERSITGPTETHGGPP